MLAIIFCEMLFALNLSWYLIGCVSHLFIQNANIINMPTSTMEYFVWRTRPQIFTNFIQTNGPTLQFMNTLLQEFELYSVWTECAMFPFLLASRGGWTSRWHFKLWRKPSGMEHFEYFIKLYNFKTDLNETVWILIQT